MTRCFCGALATSGSSRGECGKHFRDRMRSISVDTSSFDTAGHIGPYYDPEPIREVFGADSRERMLDETNGYGPAYSSGDAVYHRSRATGDTEKLSAAEVESAYLGARKARENR